MTLKFGSLQETINTNSKTKAAFAKYQIEVDTDKKNTWRGHPMIKGATRKELRSPKWAARFLAASMEPAVVVALVDRARKKNMKPVAADAKKYRNKTNGLRFFDTSIAKAILTTVHNNRLTYPRRIVKSMVKEGARSAKTVKTFIEYYMWRALRRVYANDAPGTAVHIYRKIYLGKTDKKGKVIYEGDARKWKSRRRHYRKEK